VVNFAAESHVDRSILMPALFVRTNIMGTTNLLNAALNHWEGDWEEKRFLQISTDEVYGSLGETGYFTEKTPLDPHTPYAASKAGADLIVKAYHDTYGLPVIISRCTNNYGPYQFPEKLIPLVINNALHRKKLPVYGDGRQIRDWLYVEDHCQALDLILHRGKTGEVYNIGGHNERTNLSVVQTVISYLREHVDPGITEDLIAFVPDRKGHDFRYGIDPAKICNELGWRPETPFAEGIVRTIRWYLAHRDWLERVTAGEYQEYYRRVYWGR
jgi:dTDP-glucose 4,6-dehydratase